MEQNGKAHFLLVVLFSGALAAFAYSMGRQSGERDMRDVFERTALERRMPAVIDSDHDLYMGDEDYEGDVVGTTEDQMPTAEGHAALQPAPSVSHTNPLP